MNRFIQLHDVGFPVYYIFDKECSDDFESKINLRTPSFSIRDTPILLTVNPDTIEEVFEGKHECKKIVREKVKFGPFKLFTRTNRRVIVYQTFRATFVRFVSGKVYWVSERQCEIEKMIVEATK